MSPTTPSPSPSRIEGHRNARRGLLAAKDALRPGGVLAIWSAARDYAFAARLRKAGFTVDEVLVPARSNGKGPKHVIWFAVPE